MKLTVTEGATIAKWAIIAGVALYVVTRGPAALANAAGQVISALDPTNNENIINQGATGFYQAVTGSTGTIGGDLYDVTHPTGYDTKTTPYENPIHGAYTSWVRWVTGDKDATLGTQIYDWTH